MKRLLSLFLVLTMMLVTGITMVSCAAPTNVKKEASSGGGTMQRILDSGVLRAGIALNGPPIGFRDDKGEPSGYDVDFAKQMADILKVKLEIIDVDGETRIPAITSGRVDVIFANITGNLERAKTISFSIPYLKAGIKMLTPSNSPYKTVEDLNKPGVKVVVGRGTTGEDLAVKYAPKAEIIYVPNFTDQVLQLQQGKADAAFEDSTLVDYAATQSKGALMAQEKRYTSDPICIGFAKGDPDFARWVDMFVSWQITQGFQSQTYEKWWGVKPGDMTAIW